MTRTETLEAATMGELMPRVLELTQAAVEDGHNWRVMPEKLPDGRRWVTVTVWKAEDAE